MPAATEYLDDFTRAGALALIRRARRDGHWIAPRLAPGPHDSLADVPGVRVGHTTLDQGGVQTGCTAIDFGAEPLIRPLPCGTAVFNGFAKPVGLTQLTELGELSGPILLGNTYSIGALFDAAIRWATLRQPSLGREAATFNPVALECNDGYLNDLQAQAIDQRHALAAIDQATAGFTRGAVGAGRGMSSFGVKGGIGSASRLASAAGHRWCVGALVLANFGRARDFTLDGVRLGPWLAARLGSPNREPPEKGSIIVVLGTDAPLDPRRLSRLARRAGIGIGRCGACWGHGSGDIALAVSVADQAPPLADETLDELFQAAADATEAAIVDALTQAQAVVGFRQHRRESLSDLLEELAAELTLSTGETP
ncbi:P1 family peptidase [Halotalea alkalilenta]|uniref:P1 family peptidase n=1 Tax=Halotalea alkalilenta TaxID=376489 RepID=UPI0006945E1D|nr:P1 family peptidase [Halotalea alkalilenta]